MPKLQGIITRGRYYASFLNFDIARIYLRGKRSPLHSTREHIDAAIAWICRAQDVSGDGGVSRSYSFVYNPHFKRAGWVASYPETTGYIIPTMFDYARLANRRDVFDRAVRMADWECRVQMDNGAVQGGTIDQRPTPAVFNTGQVIFGWVRAYQETGEKKFMEAAQKAGAFLVNEQDSDGSWRKNLSDYASATMTSYTYNMRSAWGLLLLSTVDQSVRFREAAIRNIEFGIGQQLNNGWFKSNCLNDPARPLLHTIAYAIRGVLESGVLLDNQTYIQSAGKAADALIAQQRKDGSLPGRFNEKWEPTVSWSCLTGDAQISIIWSRLYQLTGEQKYADCVTRINRYLMNVQLVHSRKPDIYGGISGADPLHGAYGRFEILNWAVKFFIDALLLELSTQQRNA